MSKQNEWFGYIEEVLSSKQPYVDTKKTVIVDDQPLIQKTVRTSEQVVSWTENKEGDIVDVHRTYRQPL